MLDRRSGSYTMEALALVAILCIAAIFVFSHFQREADSQDAQARRFAQELPAKIAALFQAQPEAELSPQALKTAGVEVPAPLQVDVPLDHRRATDWQVRVWHPEGRLIYTLSAQGMQKDYR